MDVMSFLKTVPAVIGVAGLLTYFMRPQEPVIDDFPDVLRSARNTLVVLACLALIAISVWLIWRPAPPDHDATLKEGHSGLALLCSLEDGRECLIGRRRT